MNAPLYPAMIASIIAGLTLSPVTAHARELLGSDVSVGCRIASGQPGTEAVNAGVCIGVLLATIRYESGKVCVPDDVDLRQLAAVATRFLDQHPGRWNEPFVTLAREALEKAWPCNH